MPAVGGGGEATERMQAITMKHIFCHSGLGLAAVLAALMSAGLTHSVDAQIDSGVAGQDVREKKVSLTLENADLRYALKLLFNAAGVNYSLDQNAQGAVTV